MQDYRKLDVWAAAHRLTLELYGVTRAFPREELFGLTSQVRRAAASIGANLAEGCGMGSDPAFARFVQTAAGSASELDYHLLLARDLELIGAEVYTKLVEDLGSVRRRLTSLLAKLRDGG